LPALRLAPHQWRYTPSAHGVTLALPVGHHRCHLPARSHVPINAEKACAQAISAALIAADAAREWPNIVLVGRIFRR
jgi:hypothetical protein